MLSTIVTHSYDQRLTLPLCGVVLRKQHSWNSVGLYVDQLSVGPVWLQKHLENLQGSPALISRAIFVQIVENPNH